MFEKYKKLLLILLALLFLALVALLVWLLFFQKPAVKETASNAQKSASTSSTTQTDTAKKKTEAPPPPAKTDTELITEALVAKTSIPANQINVTISQNSGGFAKGYVGTKGEDTGGGYFLAVKVNGAWIIAYDGQANPDCSVVNPYNFPVSMVPECLDANGNVVQR